MEFPVILTPGEDGYVIAECPIIPGCISQGRTREEAVTAVLANEADMSDLLAMGELRLPFRFTGSLTAAL